MSNSLCNFMLKPLGLKMPNDSFVQNFIHERVSEIIYDIKKDQTEVVRRTSMNSVAFV